MGSLVAAAGSFLSTKSRGGDWLVRIEDLDPQRAAPGCADGILRTLEAFGFQWSGEVVYQSRRTSAYVAALDLLKAAARVFPCSCSRAQIIGAAEPGAAGEGRYPGTCRERVRQRGVATALRVRTHNFPVSFTDRFVGPRSQCLETETGDFVVQRADGVASYQLAVVVDDEAAAVTEVIRGADLLSSTGRQIHLQQLLGYSTPEYGHLPLVMDREGNKLSKQTKAPPLNTTNASVELSGALSHLGIPIARELVGAPVRELWEWANAKWREGPASRFST